jgi:hypothetical protein
MWLACSTLNSNGLGHERVASRAPVLGGADGGDDLVDEVERLDEALDDVRAPLGLGEAVLRAPGDDLDLVGDVGDEGVAQVEGAGHAVDQGDHVDPKVVCSGVCL